MASDENSQFVVEIVKNIFQLPGLQRAKGAAGSINKLQVQKFGVDFDMYTDNIGLPSYWPNSLLVTVRVKRRSLSFFTVTYRIRVHCSTGRDRYESDD